MSTFDNPHQYSVGVKYVIVNGKLTMNDGKHTGARNGRTVKRGG